MVLTVKPAFGANVSSKDWERFFGKWFPNGVFDGLQVTAGSGLNVNISAGTGHINGYFIESDATENRSVNASSTNRVWCRLTRDASNFVTGWNFHITTTATPPSDSFLLAEVVTSGSAVTSVTDTRNSGMAGTILDATPSTSNTKPHLRVRDTTTASPYLEFVKSDGTSLSLGMRLISITTFTSSGTYVPPSGTKFLIVEMTGGGGGGGGGGSGANSTQSIVDYGAGGGGGGGGGGSGGWVRAFIFDIASSYTVTIGAGGSSGNGGGTSSSSCINGSNGSSGGHGGATSFHTIQANGGFGGSGGTGGKIGCNTAPTTASGGGGGGGGGTNLSVFTTSYVINGTGGGGGGSGSGNGNGGNGVVGGNFILITRNITYSGGSNATGGADGGPANADGGGGGGGGGGSASAFGSGGNGGNGGNGANSAGSSATSGANGTNATVYGTGGGGGGGGGGGAVGTHPRPLGGAGGNGGSGASGVVIVYAYG
jgi:hypothetical protein